MIGLPSLDQITFAKSFDFVGWAGQFLVLVVTVPQQDHFKSIQTKLTSSHQISVNKQGLMMIRGLLQI